MRRFVLAALAVLTLAVPASAAAPVTIAGFTTWTSGGSRLGFVATSVGGRKGYLWVSGPDGSRPALLRSSPPVGLEEIDRLVAGPNGTWVAAQLVHGVYSRVDVVSARGGGAAVATSGSVRAIVGDGAFLGYLSATSTGVLQLFRITGARSTRIATLPGVKDDVREAVVAGGNLAVLENGGAVDVFTLGGARLARIATAAADVALTSRRVVVRSRDRHIAVFGVRGGVVHRWRLAATSFAHGLATDGRYAVYIGANRALHAMRLVNGRDRIVARAGAGFFFDGVAVGAAGAVAPLTVAHGSRFTVTFRAVPAVALRRAVGG